MKKSTLFSLFVAGLVAIAGITGCVTSKQVTTNPTTGVTTTNTVVNTAQLNIDCAVLQTSFAIGTSVAVQKDPSVVPILTDVTLALNGVLHGASTNSASQVLTLLGKNSNSTIAANITPIINSLSSFEQNLLNKYGTNVAGQISIAVTTAVDQGILAGLPAPK
jgi:hypothetical protein